MSINECRRCGVLLGKPQMHEVKIEIRIQYPELGGDRKNVNPTEAKIFRGLCAWCSTHLYRALVSVTNAFFLRELE